MVQFLNNSNAHPGEIDKAFVEALYGVKGDEIKMHRLILFLLTKLVLILPFYRPLRQLHANKNSSSSPEME